LEGHTARVSVTELLRVRPNHPRVGRASDIGKPFALSTGEQVIREDELTDAQNRGNLDVLTPGSHGSSSRRGTRTRRARAPGVIVVVVVFRMQAISLREPES